jgi:ferredoxin-type protein NapH
LGKKRKIVQALTALVYNLNLRGFAEGTIYHGKLKNVCVPGLNCYSCPGALGSCPIGSLQSSIGAMSYKISLYVSGILIFVGALLGRFICGWACPFGLAQELLYKIPSPKLQRKRAFGMLKYGKYVMLAGLVLLVPYVMYLQDGFATPTFCKYVCPAGTLEAGIPLVSMNETLRQSIGWLFSWKVLLLVATVVLSVFVFRPFCRFVCPLGAIYGLFNRISVFGLRLEAPKCTHCNACARVCKLDVNPSKTPGSAECIRCGDCVKACPTGALRFGTAFRAADKQPAETLSSRRG